MKSAHINIVHMEITEEIRREWKNPSNGTVANGRARTSVLWALARSTHVHTMTLCDASMGAKKNGSITL